MVQIAGPHPVSDSGLQCSVSNNFPGDAYASGPETTLPELLEDRLGRDKIP